MRIITIYLLLSLSLYGCKEKEINKERKEFYYPDQTIFVEIDNYEFVDIKTFNNFNSLIDSVENLKYSSKPVFLKFKKDDKTFNILASTFFGQDYPPLIKIRNIISVGKDSIWKYKKYPIQNLEQVLKKDLENFGRDNSFSDSPYKLIVSVTSELNELEAVILNVCTTFNKIKKESSDSLVLNLQLNRRFEIFPPPPIFNK